MAQDRWADDERERGFAYLGLPVCKVSKALGVRYCRQHNR